MLKQVGHTNKDRRLETLPRPLKGSAVCATVSISGKGQHIESQFCMYSQRSSPSVSSSVFKKTLHLHLASPLTTDILLTVLILPDVGTPCLPSA